MGDDDRRRPPGPDGLPNVPQPPTRPVPSPWGDVVIPDDISELADEAAEVRVELRRAHLRRRWVRLLGLADEPGQPGIMGPVLIVVLAMTVAMASLFGSFWPYRSTTEGTSEAPVRGVGKRLPQVTLSDASGNPVRLNDIRPAVILAIGRCTCNNLVAETAALADREQVTLVVVGQPTAPALPPIVEGDDPDAVRSLGDTRGALTRAVAPSRPPRAGTAVTVLVAADGSMTQLLTDVRSAEEFAAGVARLH